MAGPQFVRYFPEVIAVLKDLGNSGTPSEVRERIAARMKLTDGELNSQTKSGISRFENQVAWARFYLAKAGYIDASSVAYGASLRAVMVVLMEKGYCRSIHY